VSVVANVAINVNSRGAVNKLRQVQTQSQQTERAVEGLSRAFGGLAAAFGAGFALTKVIADVKELDTSLRRLGTVGGNVAALDKGLGALSDRLDGVANKAELAAASYQALSAGFTETGTNLRVVEAATKAAVGGLVDVTSVVEVTTKTLNAYNMSGDQAAKVTDGISKAVELGQVQWSDYTSQLGRVASIAALAGVSLDELNAFVAAATKNGATAEVAFTGLSATLSQILTPAKESQEAAAKLGIQWNLAGLNAKGLSGLMDELAAAMDKDKEAAARMVGPIEAARGAFAAASKDGSDFKNILEQIGGAAGKADADFQTMKGSLENTLKALDTSFKNLSEALGTAFGPTVVIAVQDITKAVNGFADFMATVPQPVMDTTGELVKLIAQMILLKKAIDAIIGLRLAFIGAMTGMTGATAASGTAATTSASAFALYTNNTRALQAQAATATPVLVGLRNVLSTIAAIGVITVAVNIAISGFQSLLAANAELDKLRGRKASGGAATMFAGSSKEEVSRQQANARKTLEHEQKTLKGLQSPGSRLAQFVNLGGVLEGLGVPSIQSAGRREMQAKARMGSAQAVLGLDANRFPSATPTPVANAMGTPVGSTVGGASTGGGGGASRAASDAKRAADQAAQAEQQIQDRLRGLTREIELNAQISTIKELQFQAEMDGNKELQARLQGEERIIQIMQSTAQSLDGITDQRLQQKILAKAEGEIASARQETALEMQRIEAERTKSFNEIIAGLDLELALKTATTEQAREQLRLEAEIAKLRGQGFTPEQIGTITAKKTELAAPKTDQQNITEKIGTLKDEIADLTSISNIAITSAEGIGNAFAQSFQGLISGTMTAKEALGSFFKSVADMFLEMAAQIIAKQITMIILQTILKALGAVGGIQSAGSSAGSAAFGGSGPTFNPGAFSMPQLAGRAAGGPVTSQQPYMVGERGRELFVPGTGGSVVSNGDLRSAMNGGSGGGSGYPVLNMSFQSTSINGVEYVSREQLESAMAETRRNATRDGAKRGMTMTLDRIQNSSSTRRRAGI
jgi:TP901 family phage tail tape measure protein